jgi:hypothetical protein
LKVFAVFPLLVPFGFLLRDLPGYLTAKVHNGNARDLMEHVSFDVIVERFLGDAELRMARSSAKPASRSFFI